MLTELEIENFKPFGKPQIAEFAPITLIYGPNSGGKSSILQSLLLLRQSLTADQAGEFRLIPRGYYIDLGSFRALLHKHDLNRTFRIRMRYRSPLALYESLPRARGVEVPAGLEQNTTLEFVAGSWPGTDALETSELSRIAYEVEGGRVVRCGFVRSDYELPDARDATVLYDWEDHASARSMAKFFMEACDLTSLKAMSPIEGDLPSYTALNERFWAFAEGALPNKVLPKIDGGELSGPFGISYKMMILGSFLSSLSDGFESLMKSIQYVGPLRTIPERQYPVSGADSLTVGVRGESMAQVLYRGHKDVVPTINDRFLKLGLTYKMTCDAIAGDIAGEAVGLNLIDTRSGIPVSPADVGFGIGQLLPIVIQGLISRSQVICVEQPELHLHPRLQANLADFFMDTAGLSQADSGETGRGFPNQWIIETHSEALVRRFQRRIREGRLDPSSVSVLYVNPCDDGSADILRLRVDERGAFIDPWPDGFFEEGYREVFGPAI